MAPKRRSLATESTSLSPEDADVLRLVQENLRLLSELRSRYRSASRGGPNGRQIRSPQDIADLLAPEMEMLPQEQMRVILMDRRNRVVDVVMVYQGSVSTAVVRMAEIFRGCHHRQRAGRDPRPQSPVCGNVAVSIPRETPNPARRTSR